MVSLKELCKGVEGEMIKYLNYSQCVVLFFSQDLNQLYNIVLSDDNDALANHQTGIKS